MSEGYFEATFRGHHPTKSLNHDTTYYVHITRKFLRGYNVTLCRGHDLKELHDYTLHYSNLAQLVQDWDIAGPIDPETIHLGTHKK